MSAPLETLADREPMSWEHFRELDDSVPGEYIDGCLVMAPRPDNEHQNAIYRLKAALESVVPDGYLVDGEFGWSPAPGAYFVPDVMVYPADPATPLAVFKGIPALVVEVLSQNRSDDLVIKMSSYASFGLPQYWIVDRAAGSLDAYTLNGGSYRRARPGVGNEAVAIDFGLATLTISVPNLLTRPR